jgi:hypothetical protein
MPWRMSSASSTLMPLIRHAEVVEDLDDLAGEAAHRELRRALHEEHHVVLHLGFDLVVKS